jgi:hypothetical protein
MSFCDLQNDVHLSDWCFRAGCGRVKDDGCICLETPGCLLHPRNDERQPGNEDTHRAGRLFAGRAFNPLS